MTVAAHIDLGSASNWRYPASLGRVFAGAVLFSLPILMTMEMWWLGLYLEATNLVQFASLNFLVLFGLSRGRRARLVFTRTRGSVSSTFGSPAMNGRE